MAQHRIGHILSVECRNWSQVRHVLLDAPATAVSILPVGDGTFTVSRPLTEDERPLYDHLLPDEKEPA